MADFLLKKSQNYLECTAVHVDFLHNFCFASKHQAFITWVEKIMFRSRQLMIWHQNWSIMANKPKKKISFDAKSSIGSCETSVLLLMKTTLDVSLWNKNCRKNPVENVLLKCFKCKISYLHNLVKWLENEPDFAQNIQFSVWIRLKILWELLYLRKLARTLSFLRLM